MVPGSAVCGLASLSIRLDLNIFCYNILDGVQNELSLRTGLTSRPRILRSSRQNLRNRTARVLCFFCMFTLSNLPAKFRFPETGQPNIAYQSKV